MPPQLVVQTHHVMLPDSVAQEFGQGVAGEAHSPTSLAINVGLSAGTPTRGLCVWCGLPYNMVAGIQGRAWGEGRD